MSAPYGKESGKDKIDYSQIKLSKSETEKIRTRVIKNARAQCSVDFRAYIDCMDNNVVTGAWRCRRIMFLLNDCLSQYTTEADFAQQRLDLFTERIRCDILPLDDALSDILKQVPKPDMRIGLAFSH
eukprot:CFRG1878T1